MDTLFVSKPTKVRRHENTIQIETDKKKISIPVEHLSHLVMLSESNLNTRLLALCGQAGVRVSIFDYYGYYKGTYEPNERNSSGLVKLKQAELILNEIRRLALSREIIRGAISNMEANLKYYRYRGAAGLEKPIDELGKLKGKLTKAVSTQSLMGIEGNAHQVYFGAWKLIDSGLDFGKRIRRPPNNPVNCLISFLNQLVYSVVRNELKKTHLEETFSFLHSPSSGRSSLSLDLAEPFKPILSDMLIFRLIRKHFDMSAWFDQKEGVCLLTEHGRKELCELFAARLEESYDGKTYRRWVYEESLKIEREVLGVSEYFAFIRKP